MIPLILTVATILPLDLNALSVQDAIEFDGLPVLASVEAVNPPDQAAGVTYFGDDTQPDRWLQTATLPGDHDIPHGERVVVAGRLRVIVHPPSVIDGQFFRGLAEVRVVGWCKLSP